jgi:hypothetical protein
MFLLLLTGHLFTPIQAKRVRHARSGATVGWFHIFFFVCWNLATINIFFSFLESWADAVWTIYLDYMKTKL